MDITATTVREKRKTFEVTDVKTGSGRNKNQGSFFSKELQFIEFEGENPCILYSTVHLLCARSKGSSIKLQYFEPLPHWLLWSDRHSSGIDLWCLLRPCGGLFSTFGHKYFHNDLCSESIHACGTSADSQLQF